MGEKTERQTEYIRYGGHGDPSPFFRPFVRPSNHPSRATSTVIISFPSYHHPYHWVPLGEAPPIACCRLAGQGLWGALCTERFWRAFLSLCCAIVRSLRTIRPVIAFRSSQ